MNARKWMSVIGLAAASLLATGVSADNEGQSFDNRSIRGNYGFSLSGSAVIPIPGNPPQLLQAQVAAVGRFRSDGNGNIPEGLREISINGTAFTQTFVCTYQIQRDGTGTAECTVLETGLLETFFVVLNTNAKEFQFVTTTPGTVVVGVARKQ